MDEVIADLLAWWDECAQRGVPALLFCYALGQAQRLLAELALRCDRVAHVHGALLQPVQHYRDAGIALLPTVPIAENARGAAMAGELIMAPPSAANSPWMRRFANASTAFASGWMQVRGHRRRRGFDRGFVISDHADWPGLLRSVADSGAPRIYVTHGDADVLTRHLRELGHDALALDALERA
jgi:putative mRNA 3-end processing factor